MEVENTVAAPPFDRELAALLASAQVKSTMKLQELIGNRSMAQGPPIEETIARSNLVMDEEEIPGRAGDPPVLVSVLKKRGHKQGGAGIYHIHGGGMIGGNRFTGIDRVVEWIDRFDCVAVSVEYRLAPENPDPAPVDDCFAGLKWAAQHAQELEYDPSRLVIVGGSAGGGLAAGATLMARDQGGPALAAQILISPMLDDRNESISSYQFDGIGVWDRVSNITGWDALLGDRRASDQVSPYAAPARATDLAGLPPTYIDCGSAEVFRDEDIAYAMGMWAAGGSAELHVWSGAHHGFDLMFPTTTLSRLARQARTDFLRRIVM